jgi:hypothetical protein
VHAAVRSTEPPGGKVAGLRLNVQTGGAFTCTVMLATVELGAQGEKPGPGVQLVLVAVTV